MFDFLNEDELFEAFKPDTKVKTIVDIDCDYRLFGSDIASENKASKCIFFTYSPSQHQEMLNEDGIKINSKYSFLDIEKYFKMSIDDKICDYFISVCAFCWCKTPRFLFGEINRVLKKNKTAKVLFLNLNSKFYEEILDHKMYDLRLINSKDEGLVQVFQTTPILFPFDDFFIMANEEGFDVKNIVAISPDFENETEKDKKKLIQIVTLAKK